MLSASLFFPNGILKIHQKGEKRSLSFHILGDFPNTAGFGQSSVTVSRRFFADDLHYAKRKGDHRSSYGLRICQSNIRSQFL